MTRNSFDSDDTLGMDPPMGSIKIGIMSKVAKENIMVPLELI